MRDNRAAAVAVAALIAVPFFGCQRRSTVNEQVEVTPLRGQVFVTVNEGSSVKLGGVEVLACGAEDVVAAVKRAKSEFAADREATLKRLRVEAESAAEAESSRLKQAIPLQQQELSRIASEIERLEERLNAFANLGGPSQYSGATLPELTISVGDAVGGDLASFLGPVHRTIRSESGSRKEIWFRSDLVFVAEQGKIVAIADSSDKQTSQMGERLTALRKKQASIQEGIKRASNPTIKAVEIELPDLEPSAEWLFDRLPSPIATSLTDADGAFSLDVPTRGRFAVAAHATRKIISTTEEHYWLIWVEPEEAKKPIYLTNRNLMTSDSPSVVVNVKAAVLPETAQ